MAQMLYAIMGGQKYKELIMNAVYIQVFIVSLGVVCFLSYVPILFICFFKGDKARAKSLFKAGFLSGTLALPLAYALIRLKLILISMDNFEVIGLTFFIGFGYGVVIRDVFKEKESLISRLKSSSRVDP